MSEALAGCRERIEAKRHIGKVLELKKNQSGNGKDFTLRIALEPEGEEDFISEDGLAVTLHPIIKRNDRIYLRLVDAYRAQWDLAGPNIVLGGAETETKKKSKRTRFDMDVVFGDNGVDQLLQLSKMKFKGKGHESSDLNRLMQHYRQWAFNLYPKLNFAQLVKRLEVYGTSRRAKDWIRETRIRMMEAELKAKRGHVEGEEGEGDLDDVMPDGEWVPEREGGREGDEMDHKHSGNSADRSKTPASSEDVDEAFINAYLQEAEAAMSQLPSEDQEQEVGADMALLADQLHQEALENTEDMEDEMMKRIMARAAAAASSSQSSQSSSGSQTQVVSPSQSSQSQTQVVSQSQSPSQTQVVSPSLDSGSQDGGYLSHTPTPTPLSHTPEDLFPASLSQPSPSSSTSSSPSSSSSSSSLTAEQRAKIEANQRAAQAKRKQGQ